MLEKMWERAPLIVGEPIASSSWRSWWRPSWCARAVGGETDRPAASHAVRAGALSVVLVWGLDHLVRRLLVDNPSIAWWAFAVPIAVGALALCVRPETPPTRNATDGRTDRGGSAAVVVELHGSPLAARRRRPRRGPDDHDRVRRARLLSGRGRAMGPARLRRWRDHELLRVGVRSSRPSRDGAPGGVGGARLRRIAAPPFPDAGVADERLRRRAASDAVVSSPSDPSRSRGRGLPLARTGGLGSVGAGIPGVGDFTWATRTRHSLVLSRGPAGSSRWLLSFCCSVSLRELSPAALRTSDADAPAPRDAGPMSPTEEPSPRRSSWSGSGGSSTAVPWSGERLPTYVRRRLISAWRWGPPRGRSDTSRARGSW